MYKESAVPFVENAYQQNVQVRDISPDSVHLLPGDDVLLLQPAGDGPRQLAGAHEPHQVVAISGC